ncbi:MAG: N-acetylmuramoyl-L-alanine amidase [Clostridiales bacterium]|jgi:N-acetylmuramoyl-L-alanine amidase CwlA|nr:N-acetylmuramoyl-L-alanine amidase [Clostridiales bacterium]
MKIIDALLTKGIRHGRAGRSVLPQGIVVHGSTTPGATAMQLRDFYERGTNGHHVSTHYIIGLKGEIIRTVPENEAANHVGEAYSSKYIDAAKTGNGSYFGVEACHYDESGRFTEYTIAGLTELLADICKRHGFGADRVFTHEEITGQPCPLYYVKNKDAWEKLKKMVNAQLISQAAVSDGAEAMIKAGRLAAAFVILQKLLRS